MICFILVVNGQFEFRRLSRRQVIYFYLGWGDAEVILLSQSRRGEEDDQ
jgi:hypothetical protein